MTIHLEPGPLREHPAVEPAGPGGDAYEPSLRASTFRERLQHGDTYGLLLALILLGYVVMGSTDNTRWSRAVMAVVMGAILVLALHTSHAHQRLVRTAVVVSLACVALALSQAALDSDLGVAALGYAMFALAAVAPVVVLVRIFRHPEITVETLLGAFSAYLLIGLVFAGMYRGFDAWSTHGFFAQTDDPSPVQYMYFSFTTLTTTGYGDLTPAHDDGRVLANFEQLIGQVFLVTVVSGIVTNLGRVRRSRTD